MWSELEISGAFEIQPTIYRDSRGEFREWFKESTLQDRFPDLRFCQSNVSVSRLGTIRGIHYSLDGPGQSKLVTCLSGRILDVAVDIRIGSPSFGQYSARELSAEQGNSLFLSGNLGHAFMALEENSTVAYLLSSEYNPTREYAISPSDEEINISWPEIPFIISDKDKNAPLLEEQLVAGLLPHN